MIHRLLKFLVLVSLNPVVASLAFFGRSELGGQSPWELNLEDVFGAGAAGIEAVSKLWDVLTAPEGPTTPSGAPSKQPDEWRPETPDSPAFPLFESTQMKTCAMARENSGGQNDGLAVENSWWQVEQEPETGCVAPLPPHKNGCGYD